MVGDSSSSAIGFKVYLCGCRASQGTNHLINVTLYVPNQSYNPRFTYWMLGWGAPDSALSGYEHLCTLCCPLDCTDFTYRIEVLRYIKTTIPELWGWNSFLPSYSDLLKSAWKEFYRSILIKYFALPARRFLC
jgi:hypothetical protein